MIEAIDLSKNYGSLEAVSKINFSIGENKVIGLLGPNGAGKTSTMRMLTTFLKPSSGEVKIAGFSLSKNPEKIRENIGYLPESPPLYSELSVEEQLKFVARIKGLFGKKLKSAFEETLEACFLQQARKKLCSELSKGYRQRLGLAQAIIHRPKVIILDEPTSGLDPEQIIGIRKLIKELGEKHCVLLSTHILQEVSETCSELIIMKKGKIVVQAELANLLKEKTLEQTFLEAIL